MPGNKAPDTARQGRAPADASGSGSVDAFLEAVSRMPAPSDEARGRLIFALDATMSRQPTWDIAASLQGRMFETAARLGGLDVQLVYYRGFMECKASRFVENGAGLAQLMSKIDVRGGQTQIAKVLKHVRMETKKRPVGAFVFVGDAMEENADELCTIAGELGLLGVKAFMFHEGHDPDSAAVFREIARLTGGAFANFDHSAPQTLSDLLSAAAAYAAGGRKALEQQARSGQGAAQALLTQMR